ncbi:uncharacterized protein [Nicotiana sylvestris]|uniref:uncharacterized protein n=1 Tax=Nicotiana sylvestris TaxID=4096 RepID=UPI00388C9C4C
MVKFKHKDQEIVVHREDEQLIYRDPSIPCLEAREGSEHIVYQAIEIVVADECEKGKPCPQPFLSNASIMVAKEMIRHDYKLGKGLGYHQVLMDEEDAEKTAFTILWGTYCYRVIPFGLKNAGATYMRAMTAIFHDMMYQEIEVYVDDLTSMCEPIFKLLKKYAAIKWTNECQKAFDKIKEYLSHPPVLVPPVPGRPLFLYLTVLENSFGYVLGQHDVTGKKEQAIYYLSKKFTSYEAKQHVEDLGKRFKSIEFRYIPRCHNELADGFATLASMLPYPSNAHINPLEIQIRERHGYCNTVEAEPNIQPWYHDIKRFLKTKEYLEKASGDQKRTIRRHASGFFLSGDVLYKRTPNLNLLRCVDAEEAGRIMQWHEKFPFALLGYRTTVRTSIRSTPHLLVYGTEAVIPVEVEIPSLRTIVEAKIEDSEWVKTLLEQLTLIDEKRMAAICHGQLYQQRMTRVYNKKVWPRNFEVGQLVLRHILPHHQEAKGKFAPNWKGSYIIRKILPIGALYLGDIEGNDPEAVVNADTVKRYYV